jgi:hypothetical protein
MAGPTAAAEGPEPERLVEAVREARDEAAPFALLAALALILLAVVSRQAGWKLLGHQLWWLWLIVAVPYACLVGVLELWPGRPKPHDARRPTVLALLVAVSAFTVLGVGVLVMSLVSHSGSQITGRQLLLSGAVVLLTETIAFGLAFWELDCGGPVARALATARQAPDFQYPQDENPQLARPDWSPRLADYLYVSLTNTIAFSPTDTLPLTRSAKLLMAAESILSGVTILLVAARAVNILG